MITNIAFTDPQGTTFTDAAFVVYSIEQHENSYSTYRANLDDITTPIEESNSNQSMRVKYAYFVNQAAIGTALPYWLANSVNRDEYFVIDNEELNKPKYVGLSLESVAELYLQDEILPNL